MGALALRATDVMLAFPSILLALFLVAVFGRSEAVVIVALALLFVPGFVRLARSLGLSLRQRGFVEASIVSGGSQTHVLSTHLLPNAAGPLVVAFTLTASHALLAEATLSYLGIGVQLPSPSWGNMLQSSFDWLFVAWWYGILPGLCIVLVALGYVSVGAGLTELLERRGIGYRARRVVGGIGEISSGSRS